MFNIQNLTFCAFKQKLKPKCVFCDLINEKKKLLFENETFVIIKDIRPASDYHYLAIPKEHIPNATNLQTNHKPMLIAMENELKEQLSKDGITADKALFGFHWPPFISVNHLHMHGIAPKDNMTFFSRWIFKPLNIWYCTPQYVAANLKSECVLR